MTPAVPVASPDDLENHRVKQLGMISLLAMHDEIQKTHLASKAASIYLSIISAVSGHCGNSVAGQVVVNSYAVLLRPHIDDSWRDRNEGRDESSTSSTPNRVPVCEICIKGFDLFGLPFEASQDEVKQKRSALAELLHPDKLGGKSERAQNAGEQQMKSINAACDHIMECRFSGAAS